MLFIILLQTDNTGNDITKHGGATNLQICWTTRWKIFRQRKWPTSVCVVHNFVQFSCRSCAWLHGACPHQVLARPRPNTLAIPQSKARCVPFLSALRIHQRQTRTTNHAETMSRPDSWEYEHSCRIQIHGFTDRVAILFPIDPIDPIDPIP
jgi:hypothetical protein